MSQLPGITSSPNMDSKKYVVITRAAHENQAFADAVRTLSLEPLLLPTITQTINLSSTELAKYFSSLSSYDWLIFTSSNGVNFFVEAAKEQHIDITQFAQLKIAAVGEKTAETAMNNGLNVDFIPPKFTAKDLNQEMPPVTGKKILLPRSAIGKPELAMHLEEKGALVTDMPMYTTVTRKISLEPFWELLQTKQILCLTFTSPSTVQAFMENCEVPTEALLSLPVCSIGPTTTEAAKQYRFTEIYNADVHTTDGMITKIKESIL